MKKSGKITIIVSVIIALVLVMAFVFAKPEPRGLAQCKDTIDNDGDGYTDWPNDAGCASRNDNDESNCGDSICEGGEVCNACVADCGHCDSCSDSDGGIYEWIFGTTSGYFDDVFYSYDDYCVDSGNVIEYYCSGNSEQSTQQNCGTDYGSNICYLGDVYYNSTDYYCSSGKCNADYAILTLVQDCVSGQYCSNGQCLWYNSCSDTDSYNLWSLGTVSGYFNNFPYSYEDYCVDSDNVMEYWCYNGTSRNQSSMCYDSWGEFYCLGLDIYVNITSNYCDTGKCVNGEGSTPTYYSTCEIGCINGNCTY